MSKALALLVGIKDGGACAGSELDVDNIHRILYPLGYDVRTLKTEDATHDRILQDLEYASSILKSGDIFVFYYSGHGGQQPDYNSDEHDGKDETLCAYDRDIVDDELNEIWQKMIQGVRIVMISDSCNAGTNYKNRGKNIPVNPTPFQPIRRSENSTVRQMKSQMIHMGGCFDGAGSAGWPEGGEFTIALCKAWQNGNFNGNYQEFYRKILDFITTNQNPVFNEYGPVSQEFKNQRPFTVETDIPITDLDSATTTTTIEAIVSVSSLNIRKGPGVEYQKIGSLNKGDVVNIYDFDGKEVWVEIEPGKWAAMAYNGKRYMTINWR